MRFWSSFPAKAGTHGNYSHRWGSSEDARSWQKLASAPRHSGEGGCNPIARTHRHGRHPGAGRDPWHRSTTGSGQARSSKPHLESETCSTVDPGLRRDDVASIYALHTYLSPGDREHQLDYTLEGRDPSFRSSGVS